MASGYNYAVLPAGALTTAPIFFGHPQMNLRYILNQSLTAQTNGVAMYDAPSLAAYIANPTNFTLIARFVLGAGSQSSIGNLALQLYQGCVVVPLGTQNNDGGLLFAYDGAA